MTRILAWLAGLVGIAALGRWLAQRSRGAESTSVPPQGPDEVVAPTEPASASPPADGDGDPAGELRRKLAEAREAPVTADERSGETLDERRARVHAKAREAMDAMGDDGSAA